MTSAILGALMALALRELIPWLWRRKRVILQDFGDAASGDSRVDG